jgi:hypothetical protein
MDVRPTASCGIAHAESPRANRFALERLKALIFERFDTPTGAMIEARPCSLLLEVEADATPGPHHRHVPQVDLFRPTTRHWSDANCLRRYAGKRRA